MAEERQVRLFKQTYEEARRDSLVGDLELISLVSSDTPRLLGDDCTSTLNDQIIEKTRELGAGYVFGLTYQISMNSGILASGDAYRVKE